MKRCNPSEIVLVQEVAQEARQLKAAMRGLPVSALIKIIRTQLGMSQTALANRAGVPQSTISRVEQGQKETSISTLRAILDALSCDLIIAPLLRNSIDTLRRQQAKKVAKKQISYLKGTMNLEHQQPDTKFLEELLKQEEERLLYGSNETLWEE